MGSFTAKEHQFIRGQKLLKPLILIKKLTISSKYKVPLYFQISCKLFMNNSKSYSPFHLTKFTSEVMNVGSQGRTSTLEGGSHACESHVNSCHVYVCVCVC